MPRSVEAYLARASSLQRERARWNAFKREYSKSHPFSKKERRGNKYHARVRAAYLAQASNRDSTLDPWLTPPPYPRDSE